MKNAPRSLPQPQLLICCLLLSLVACSRHSSNNTPCITRSVATTVPFITATQLDTVNTYFAKNNLSTANLQFLSYFTFQTTYPGYNGSQTQITARVFINGLPVINSSEVFNFDSTGIFKDIYNQLYAIPTSTDTSAHQSLAALRQLFLNNYKKCIFYPPTANGVPVQPKVPYDDSCLQAELGYLDAGALHTGIPYNNLRIKAWIVYPANLIGNNVPYTMLFPSVIVVDSSGQTIADTVITI
jgi:hypothetical protein